MHEKALKQEQVEGRAGFISFSLHEVFLMTVLRLVHGVTQRDKSHICPYQNRTEIQFPSKFLRGQ